MGISAIDCAVPRQLPRIECFSFPSDLLPMQINGLASADCHLLRQVDRLEPLDSPREPSSEIYGLKSR